MAIDKTIRMTPETLQSYIEKAREEGAKTALKRTDYLVIHKERFQAILDECSKVCGKCECK